MNWARKKDITDCTVVNSLFHLYPLIRPLLFSMDAEKAHERALRFLEKFPFHPVIPEYSRLRIELLGHTLANPFAMAGGFDKDGRVFDKLFHYGFSLVETGTLTPLAQPGNEGIRMYRLKKEKSLINRMGFNNAGIDAFLENYRKKASSIPEMGRLGVSIGKNKNTPNEEAVQDYAIQIEKLNAADASLKKILYYAINISSPNTPGLRELQDEKAIRGFLESLKKISHRPLLVKFAPDFDSVSRFQKTLESSLEAGMDGFILTNTTSDADMHDAFRRKYSIPFEGGGISGQLLKDKSSLYLTTARKIVPANIPLIASGGISDNNTVWERFVSGAGMVQIYTGFIYSGPLLIAKLSRGLQDYLEKNHYESLEEWRQSLPEN